MCSAATVGTRGQTHCLDVVLHRAAPPSDAPDWSLITRPVAPNSIATHIVEVRQTEASDPQTFDVWVDGRRVDSISRLASAVRFSSAPPVPTTRTNSPVASRRFGSPNAYVSFTLCSFVTRTHAGITRVVELSEPDEATAVRVAVAHLDARFPSLDRDEIESVVRPRVRDRFEHSRIKSFIGILAERDARTELERIAP
jgi:hypothetical protein